MTSPGDSEDEKQLEVTRLLQELKEGNARASGDLFEALYPELRRSAEAQMRGQATSHTLQPTALVNEVFLRLCRGTTVSYEDRRHFLLAASRAMRHVLVDHARARNRLKRSAIREEIPVEELAIGTPSDHVDFASLEEALSVLEKRDKAMAKAVELRFFAGLDVAETARVLRMKERTFFLRWKETREWLRARLATDEL